MDVGVLHSFANIGMPDNEVVAREIEIAEMAEPLGYHHIGAVEHHFFDYAISPANFQLLAYMSAKTKHIKLLTGAVILPWNDPLRVIEQITFLDHLSKGRVLFGVGRGLARREYKAFQLDMNEARERFDEATEVVMRGVETGVIEGKGRFYGRPPLQLRPRPYASFRNRTYVVANSADSVPVVVSAAARMMCFATKPWHAMANHFNEFRRQYEASHGEAAPPPLCADIIVCDESTDRARELAEKYMAAQYALTIEHYELLGEHFAQTKGYGDHAAVADALRSAGQEAAAKNFVDICLVGTPTHILEKLDQRRNVVGDFDETLSFLFGGIPVEAARSGIRLFASKALPELKSWRDAVRKAEVASAR